MTFDAILIVGFGGPNNPSEVRPFLERVVAGRNVPKNRLDEVEEQYQAVGGRSPINDITFAQVRKVETLLRERGITVPVHVAMRNSAPFLPDVLGKVCDAGAKRVLCVAMSAYQGAASTGRYEAAAERAAGALGARAPQIEWARGLAAHPLFVDAQACMVAQALAQVPESERQGTPLLFTAHSVPKADAAEYEASVLATATAVASRVGHARYRTCWQSRSGAPNDPWLEPDIGDAIAEEAEQGARAVVVAPIGFIADHVEVLYDLDIKAKAVATKAAIRFYRASAVNTHAAFISAMTDTIATRFTASS